MIAAITLATLMLLLLGAAIYLRHAGPPRVATMPSAQLDALYCPCRSAAWNEALEQATEMGHGIFLGNGTVH